MEWQKRQRELAKEPFTEAEIEAIRSAVSTAWNYVAYDAIKMCDGKMPRAEAIEVATDAGRPVQLGGLDERVYQKFCAHDSKETDKIIAPLFKANTYVL